MSEFNYQFKIERTVKSKTKEYFALPVYKKAVDLIKQLTNSTQKTPNFIKIGILKDTQTDIINIIYYIQQAANSKDKQEFIKQAYTLSKKVQINIRIFYDLGFMSKGGFAATSSLSEDLVRQLYGWLNKNLAG